MYVKYSCKQKIIIKISIFYTYVFAIGLIHFFFPFLIEILSLHHKHKIWKWLYYQTTTKPKISKN